MENVSIYHYLGIDLDKNLSFEKMVENTFSKANKKLYLLKKIRPYITCSIANTVYKTHVLPILDYADFLIDSCIKRKVGTLDQIQKRAVHTIDGKTNFGQSFEGLMNIYGLRPLIKRREEHQLSMMYRLSGNIDFIDNRRPVINLRSNTKIKFPMRHTRLSKIINSPYYRAVRLWDRLSAETQRATTKVKFKIAVRS